MKPSKNICLIFTLSTLLSCLLSWQTCQAQSIDAGNTPPNDPQNTITLLNPTNTRAEAQWSKPIQGLTYHLRAERRDWLWWELPRLTLDVYNVGTEPATVGHLKLPADGTRRKTECFGELRPLFADHRHKARQRGRSYYYPVFTKPSDTAVKLAPGAQESLPFSIIALHKSGYSTKIRSPFTPGRYVVGMGYIDNHLNPVFVTNTVVLQILPPGVSTSTELDARLTQYETETGTIMAGFVPNKTTVVLGEPMFVTFIVKNLGDEPFVFSFGGDYRGTGRHDRFKIKAVDSNGNLLPDPKAGPDGSVHIGGGILSPRAAPPHDMSTERIELLDYRKIEKPGLYTVSCSFVLAKDGYFSDKSKSNIPAETTFKLTVLPRDNRNVQRVVDELLQQARQASRHPLPATINTLCSFGREAAVPGLAKMSADGDVEHRTAAINGLGQIVTEDSLTALLHAQTDPDKSVRHAALQSLGAFKQDKAVDAVVAASGDPDELIRSTAVTSLGSMKTDCAIEALVQRLPNAQPHVAASILRAMGRTKSPRVFDHLLATLSREDSTCRYAAVDGLVAFGGSDAIQALKACVDDDDMDFREMVVRKLAESLKQPIDAQWLVPVIKSKNGARSLGDSPRLMRLYAAEKAVPALLSCLDFNDPSTRKYYNYEIIYSQASCRGAMRIPWISDLNRDGKSEEIEKNRETLRKIRAWVDHYYQYRMDEELPPLYRGWREEEKFWGKPVDKISIRARVKQRIWPNGMPQLVFVDVRSHPGQGSVMLSSAPDPLEVEIDGNWYTRQPPAKDPTMGEEPGRGSSFHNIFLDDKWHRISDGQPLQLTPGKHTLRVRLSTTPQDKRIGLATCKPIHFEVIPTP